MLGVGGCVGDWEGDGVFFGGGVKFCSNYRPFGGSNPSRKIVKKNNFPHL